MGTKIDLTGQRFGRQMVLEQAETTRFGQPQWRVLCDCGGTRVVRGDTLRGGESTACPRCASDWCRKHGLAASKPYLRWNAMIMRCTNPNTRSWPNYGGRGITVCDRWKSFDNFLADMGVPPDGSLLDRIDNDGNYEPANCRWASTSESNKNRRPFKRS